MPENSAILFGGVPNIPAPEVFEQARKDNPAWYQILEKAYEQFANRPENKGLYADPKGMGATLDQVWLTFTLFGIETYCLLAQPYPDTNKKQIPRLVEVPAAELVQALKDIQCEEGSINATTLHYDGKTGHCVTVTAYDQKTDRFEYHDPWPERSLLCRENNIAGVDARAEGTRWSVSADELERIVFASFVLPAMWARHEGVMFDILFDEWTESEFFQFFHLNLIDERSEDRVVTRAYAPGPFKDHISLFVSSNDRGKIVRSVLRMDREWMLPNIMIALDLVKSFIVAFSPPPDAERYGELSQSVWQMTNPQSAMEMKNRDPSKSPLVQCVHAIMGSVAGASLISDFASLQIQNLARENKPVLEMSYTLS